MPGVVRRAICPPPVIDPFADRARTDGRRFLMQRARFAAVLAVLVAALASPADARSHATCRDGVAPKKQNCPLGDCPAPAARCDVGLACDGVCTFVVQQCEGGTCHDVNVDVPVGETMMVVVSVDPHRDMTLRCRKTRHCEEIARALGGGRCG
jgi:hypothetical protein